MDFDVVVVGASSSGLYAAEKLASAGKHVGVFEQMVELAPARRTLIVTPHLRTVLGELPTSIIIHKIHCIELECAGASFRVPLNDPDLIVERAALLRLLAARAQAAGVEFYQGSRFRAIQAAGKEARLTFQTNNGQTLAACTRAVVGADGVLSDVAKAVGARHAATVPILQTEVKLPRGWDPAVTKVWFDTDETRFFYWLIPESNERAVVGLVGDERARMRELLVRFLERHGFTPLAFQGARVALHHPRLHPWAQVGSVPVLLVGDAAGQVKVTTVGGTVSGLLGAQAAVRALLNGTEYARELASAQRELDVHWGMRLLLDRLDNGGYAALLRAITPRVQHFLSNYHRDELAAHSWQLLTLQPGLLFFALRAILKWRAPRSQYARPALPMVE